jgi:hypothetical protein
VIEQIDVMGLLLTGLVFSTGLLIGRVHQSAEAAYKLASDSSWQLRLQLQAGQALDLFDIRPQVISTERQADDLANLTKYLNRLLFALLLVAFGDGLYVVSRGIAQEPSHILLSSVLAVAGLAVTVFAELDVQRTERGLQNTLSHTTIGKLSRLADALQRRDLSAARREIAELRTWYPDWPLLVDFEALVDYLDQNDGGDRSQLATWLGTTVTVARKLSRSDFVGASEALGASSWPDPNGDRDAVQHAVDLAAIHLDAVCQDRHWQRISSARTLPNLSLVGRLSEARLTEIDERGLPHTLEWFPEMKELLETAGTWTRPGSADEEAAVAMVSRSPLLSYLISTLAHCEHVQMGDCLEWATDPLTLETLGLVAMATGDTEVGLSRFERAARDLPSSPRLHWLLAVAYERQGWFEGADSNFRRSAALAPAESFYTVVRWDCLEQDFAETSRVALLTAASPVDYLLLETIGIRTPIDQQPDSSLRAAFLTGLVAAARGATPGSLSGTEGEPVPAAATETP